MLSISANLPENTLASYRAAILEGAEGIESGTYLSPCRQSKFRVSTSSLYGIPDVHATTDGVILMFHDPTLDRTTDGKGAIKEQAWVGNIEYVSLPCCVMTRWLNSRDGYD